MSKSFLIIGSSVGAVGGVGAAGAVYWKFLSAKTSGISFRDKFEREIDGRLLLDVSGTTHDSVWEELVKEYKTEHPDRPDIVGISKSNLNQKELKAHCRQKASSEESSGFDAYVAWCSRNTLRTQFNEKVSNKTWIDSDVEGDWEVKRTGYAEDFNTTLQVPKTGVDGTIPKNEIKIKDIMDWCILKSTSPFLKDSDDTYIRASTLCTK